MPRLTATRRALRIARTALGLWVIAFGSTDFEPQPLAAQVAEKSVDFDRDVRPILSNHCFACHGPDATSLEGGLRLSERADALAEADSGLPAIVPGKPDESELVRRIFAEDADERMPPSDFKKSLTDAQRTILAEWIAQGAEYAPHWSFIPPKRAVLPSVKDPSWPANPIDLFVAARLDAAGMKPSPPAAPTTLVRRVSLDLIGMPPTPAEIDAFLADESPDAYEHLVDRLLADPRFGETWARPWLDLARYADSNGFQRDGFRDVWAYRDWVIRAINADKPYDQFVIEQLAGDLLPEPSLDQLVATGFHRQVTVNVEGGTNPEAERVNQVMDRVNTTGTVFLGLTVECAQCHSHKFDPISQHEYYSLFAFFNSTPLEVKYRNKDMASIDFIDAPAVVVHGTPEAMAKRRELQAEFNRMLEDCADEPTPEERKALAALEKTIAAIPIDQSLVMEDLPESRETHVMLRGQWDQPGDVVAPGVIEAVGQLPSDAPPNRLGLAQWLASKDNPLTARVAVNRWWQGLFGRGIVATPEDFGAQGDRPSHPELLDWLAVEFMEHGWSMKHVLREIVTSATYCQSSRGNSAAFADDPDNILLARGPRFRLPAESIRDNALAIAGLLSDTMYGRPVFPPQPPGIWRVIGKVDNTYRTSTGDDRFRRGIYTVWRRSGHYPSFATFDAPNRSTCLAARRRTNTPLQALTLLNDPVYVEAATAFAKRIVKDLPDASDTERIVHAFRLAIARRPTSEEAEHLVGVVRDVRKRVADTPGSPLPAGLEAPEFVPWFHVASILLNLDETISKE